MPNEFCYMNNVEYDIDMDSDMLILLIRIVSMNVYVITIICRVFTTEWRLI